MHINRYRDNNELIESDVYWIGTLADGWKYGVVKFNTYVKGRIGWQGLKSDEFIEEGPFLVTGSDFNKSIVDWEECYHIDMNRYREAPSIHLKNGDLLITKDGTIGKLAIVENCPQYAVLNSGIFVTRSINNQYITKFFFYMLSSKVFEDFVGLTSTGSTIKHLYQHTFVNFKFPLPEIQEQKKIANFLDFKTAKFDLIITKKEQLIKKLEEAKKSLISEVVTGKVKIVDGKLVKRDISEMKNSGVEWLGMVPKEWKVKAFKHCFKVRNGKEIVDDKKDISKPVSVYGSGGVFKSTSQVLYNGESVLFGRKGTIGKPLYVNGKFWTVDTMYFTTFSKLYYPKFFYYQLNSYPWGTITTSTALPSVVGSDVGNAKTIAPSFYEMKQLSNYLDDKFIIVDSIIDLTYKQIQTLKQAKQSLISEAVTGKIDLRDWEIIVEGELQ